MTNFLFVILVEELTCFADWKEGSTHYLVGKLEHRLTRSDTDRYRCFVYEHVTDKDEDIPKDKIGLKYVIAQSGEASCTGLRTVSEGARVMKLTRGGSHLLYLLFLVLIFFTVRIHPQIAIK